MRTTTLSPKVREAIKKDKTLFLMWRMISYEYDDEIDPLHNPDYVKRSIAHEETLFKHLLKDREELEEEWEKITTLTPPTIQI